MHQPRTLGRQGYTMIETVTTLVVAGILTTVGIVLLAPALERLRPIMVGQSENRILNVCQRDSGVGTGETRVPSDGALEEFPGP